VECISLVLINSQLCFLESRLNAVPLEELCLGCFPGSVVVGWLTQEVCTPPLVRRAEPNCLLGGVGPFHHQDIRLLFREVRYPGRTSLCMSGEVPDAEGEGC